MKKVSLILVIILFVIICIYTVFCNPNTSIELLDKKFCELSVLKLKLNDLQSIEYMNSINNLNSKIEVYKNNENTTEIQDLNNNNIYEKDFLWVIIGNYATESMLSLQMDFEILDDYETNDYVNSKLNIIVLGDYANIINFMNLLKSDNRFNFNIDNFCMEEKNNGIEANFIVNEIKIKKEIYSNE